MNKKFILISILIFLCSAVIFAAPKYISPNNDGVQDNLELSLNISDKRYIQGWSLVIMDSDKNVVRTIENKVALPEKIGFKSFFKQLITPKKGVDVPDQIVWNGAMNNGETAPDGHYYYYVTATDDNGNVGKTKERELYIDTTAPEVTVVPPSVKVFGEGEKSSIKVRQSGSKEDLWIGVIKNAQGEIVKTYKWENEEPTDFTWTGTNDTGAQVMDGVYSYEINSTDRAGNKSNAEGITNIIYSASKPATNIFVNGSKYFSPRTKSDFQNIVFAVSIEVPDEKTGNKLTEWNMNVRNKKGEIVRTYNNKNYGDIPPSSIVFDGTDDEGNILPDGKYQAEVSAKYLNGYEPDTLYSPFVVLSTEEPKAQVAPSEKVFGAGSKSSVDFDIMIDAVTSGEKNEGAPVKQWNGYIKKDSDSSIVKTYDFGEYPPEKITWDGISDEGDIAESGKYYFEIVGKDLAGNVGTKKSDVVTFDTTETELLLGLSDTAFSPNGDKIRDIVKFTPVTMTKDVISYDFSIMDENGAIVYSVKENGKLPIAFEWNGKGNDKILCKDGYYSANLEVYAANGSSAKAFTQPFVLDIVAPSLEAEIPWNYFSTNGNGNQKNIPITISSSDEKQWNCEVRNNKDIAIATYSWSGTKDKLVWDGTNNSGNIAENGTYSVIFFSTDDAGNSFTTELTGITLDNRDAKAYITAEYNGISPNNDNVLDSQIFQIKAAVGDSILSWQFNVEAEDGTAVYSISEKDSANLPSEITWNGADKDGNACEGTFKGTLHIKYLNSNEVNVFSSPFVCTATPPQLRVQTAPEYFSPDNDGVDDDLYIKLTGNTKTQISSWSFVIKDPVGNDFWTTSGKSKITERIIWDGLSNVQKDKDGNAERVQSAMDYPYEFTVSDDLGMTSTVNGIISIDVLVIRVGNVLKMAVPSIIFEPDAANFQKPTGRLTKAQVDKNVQILNRIAQILKKFSDYKVTIVGHANKITDNPLEETEDNLNAWGRAAKPLSKERADVIREYLIKQGVSASALSTDGMGGTEPVADTKDKNNNWKNRRVEFILEK